MRKIKAKYCTKIQHFALLKTPSPLLGELFYRYSIRIPGMLCAVTLARCIAGKDLPMVQYLYNEYVSCLYEFSSVCALDLA